MDGRKNMAGVHLASPNGRKASAKSAPPMYKSSSSWNSMASNVSLVHSLGWFDQAIRSSAIDDPSHTPIPLLFQNDDNHSLSGPVRLEIHHNTIIEKLSWTFHARVDHQMRCHHAAAPSHQSASQLQHPPASKSKSLTKLPKHIRPVRTPQCGKPNQNNTRRWKRNPSESTPS